LLPLTGTNSQKRTPAGYRQSRRVPDADIRFLDAGHFALETNVDDFASAILKMTVNA
jgi:hypothetical protein